jgi:hypothetical protein
MPYGRPPFIEPWERENWLHLAKGKKLYAIGQWQMHLLRNDWPLPYINEHAAEELGITRDWIRTEALNYIAARGLPPRNESTSAADGEGQEDETEGESSVTYSERSSSSSVSEFHGFSRGTSDSDSDVRGFETTLRGGRHYRPHDLQLQGDSTETSESGDHSDSASLSVASSVSDIAAAERQELREGDDLCVHRCNKKYHLLIQDA